MSTVKENILHLLVNGQGKYFSGSELAKQLGVSRNAVWKAVKQLQSAGYQIDAVTNKGYTFISEDDMLSDACIQKYLSTKALGRNLQIFPSLESTNKTAKTIGCPRCAGRYSHYRRNAKPGSRTLWPPLFLT